MWLRKLLQEFGFPQTTPLKIYEDNQGCIAMSKNPVNHERTKHIDIKYHFIREKVEDKAIEVEYLQTEDMIADILTKSMPRDRHEKLCDKMGIREVTRQ